MNEIDCITPRVFSSTRWGRDENAHVLSIGRLFGAVLIAPDSEADSVILRPNGQNGLNERILVSKDAPYFGAIHGKGLGIYPTVECPPDVAPVSGVGGTIYTHQAKVLLYPAPPPFIPDRRPQKRYWFSSSTQSNGAGGDIVFPLIPAFGRKRAFFSFGFDGNGSGQINFRFEGGRVSNNAKKNTELIDSRWKRPENAHASVWPIGGNDTGVIDWKVLSTIAAGTADEDFAYQYEGNFDFYRCTASEVQSGWGVDHLAVTLED